MGTEFKMQEIIERINDVKNRIVGWVHLKFNQEDKKKNKTFAGKEK